MNIIKSIKRAEERMKAMSWDRIFFFVDIHETILYPDYNNKEENKYYPFAKEVLQYLSKKTDVSLCLYTCSYPKEIERYIKFFKNHDIEFEMINKNIEVENTTYGYYQDKPYFNLLLDDKAGFEAEEDWKILYRYYKLDKEEKQQILNDR